MENAPDFERLCALAQQWIADDPDPFTRQELSDLLVAARAQRGAAAAELADRFGATLEFGTAGLRGVLGAGPNRMNRAVVARATWAFARVLLAGVPRAAERGVVVGGDARRMSRELGEDVAAILGAAGIRVLRFGGPVPTPLVGFAVRRLGAAGGIVITASHNPAEYNGCKVYWENGAQIVPPIDERITAAMAQAPPAREIARPALDSLQVGGFVADAPPALERAYLDAVRALAVHPGEGDRRLRIVYTPMHGVGGSLARRALAEAGFDDVVIVPEQAEPDAAFPTVSFPNPEEDGALDLALALARRVGADLVLANDPDADRLALALPEGTLEAGRRWRRLTGNELGVLLGHYLLTEIRAGSERPRAVLSTIVSSPVLGRIAATLGVRYEETLTGFKWIANRAIELERAGNEFVFGYEEALGYCIGDAVWDKDGVSAAVLAAEAAAVLRARGKTLRDELDVIARHWGAFVSRQVIFVRKGTAGAAAIHRTMQRLRASPPDSIGDDEVVARADYLARRRTDARTGAVTPLPLPSSNVLGFELASGSRVLARPSGTEPKAKFYFDGSEPVAPGEPVSEAEARAFERLGRLVEAFVALAGAAEEAAS